MARKRRWLLESEEAEIWRRRKNGATLRAIGRALNRRSAVKRAIAATLKRAPSTVSREIARHGGREAYRAGAADEAAWANFDIDEKDIEGFTEEVLRAHRRHPDTSTTVVCEESMEVVGPTPGRQCEGQFRLDHGAVVSRSLVFVSSIGSRSATGASAPGGTVMRELGISPENVAARARLLLEGRA